MAVPTLASLSASTGPTGGKILVGIAGSNYQLPAAPPATGRAPAPPPSVQVLFGSTPALQVFVLSPTLVYALAPPSPPGVVAVTIQNVDATGAVIPGETATLAGAYRFMRPDLTQASELKNAVYTLVQNLQNEVLANTVITTSVEYDDQTGDLLNVLPEGKLPVLVISAPDTPTNRRYSRNARRTGLDTITGRAFLQRSTTVVDLSFQVVGASNSTIELLNLLAALSQFFERNPYLVVGTRRYEMQWNSGGAQNGNRPNEDDIRQFSAGFVVRGVPLDEADMSVDLTLPVSEVYPTATPTTVPLPGGRSIVLLPPSYSPAEAAIMQSAAAVLEPLPNENISVATVVAAGSPVGIVFQQQVNGPEGDGS